MSRFRQVAARRFVTLAPVRAALGDPGRGMALEVPVGFGFDVSVPRALWWLFDPLDTRFLEAAALHDFALGSGWPRVAAAAPFSTALRAAGVGRTKRLAMVLGVIIWKWK